MKLFFEPQSAALLGATANKFRPGYQLFKNMEASLAERFYPVNPNLQEIEGKKCYSSVLELPETPDVAVIFIPANAVPQAIEECARKGVKAVIIESAGFEEVGEEGRKLAARCLEIAKANQMRLWGPNCMGMFNVHQMKILSFMSSSWRELLIPGKVSLVVQSGMLSAGFLMHILSRTPFGLAKVCSIGNKMDVDETDILDYFKDDPETQVIAMYLESMKRGRKFFELAKSMDKPMVVLKSGRTEFGARAARSHTAALAQDDEVLDSALRQARIIRVHGMEELLEVARCLAVSPNKIKPQARVAVITFSGGAGVVCSDELFDRGMQLAPLKPETLARLKTVFPEWMDPGNPVDVYPAIEKNGPIRVFGEAIDALMQDDNVDAVFMHIFAIPSREDMFQYEKLAEMVAKYQKPLVAWMIGHSQTAAKVSELLEKHGIAVVNEISKGIRIISALTIRR
jgi:acetyltransferase